MKNIKGNGAKFDSKSEANLSIECLGRTLFAFFEIRSETSKQSAALPTKIKKTCWGTKTYSEFNDKPIAHD